MHLDSGDRLLLLTDGVSEAHRPGQQPFGDERISAVLLDTVELPPVEVVRRLTRAVMEHCDGVLADDATAICLDWRPSHPTA